MSGDGLVQLFVQRIAHEGRTEYVLRIFDQALVKPHLDAFDCALLDECGRPSASISDVLLGLETLVRRIEQATTDPSDEIR